MKIIALIAILALSLTACQSKTTEQTTKPEQPAQTSSEQSEKSGADSGSEKEEISYLEDMKLTQLDGTEVQLSSLAKKYTVIVFWATWCPYCIQEMPVLEELLAEKEDLAVIMINGGEPKKTVEDFQKSGQTSLPLFLDENNDLVRKFGVQGFPGLYFVTDKLQIIGALSGKLDKEQFEKVFTIMDEHRVE